MNCHYSEFIQAQTIENIKAPRHWPLYGEFTGHRWIPSIMGSFYWHELPLFPKLISNYIHYKLQD